LQKKERELLKKRADIKKRAVASKRELLRIYFTYALRQM